MIIVLLMGTITVCAFATLGETNLRKDKSKKSILSAKSQSNGTFSLRSGYTYRGSAVIDTKEEKKYINLNTVITYQQGNTTYTIPLKKKVILNNRVTFNPNAATR